MNFLARSTYLRVLENRQRDPARFQPEYPLLVFMIAARFALGLAVFAGLLQMAARSPGVVVLNTAVALGCLVAALGVAMTHLGAPRRFTGMLRNPRSRLSWEVSLVGLLILLLAANLVVFWVSAPPHLLAWVLGLAIILVGLGGLTAMGLLFKLPAHPAWNTNLLPAVNLISGLILGMAFTWAAAHLLGDSFLLPRTALILAALGLLILIQLGVGGCYLNYLHGFLDQTLKDLRRGRTSRLWQVYLGAYFGLPLALIAWSLWGRLGFPAGAGLLASLLAGVWLERVLFFSLEKPVFFFYFSGEKG